MLVYNNVNFYMDDYYPSKDIKWEANNNFNSKNLFMFNANLINSNINRIYFKLDLIMIYNNNDNSCKLFIRGLLENWYYQKRNVEKFIIEDYLKCLKLISLELNLDYNKRLLKQSKQLIINSKSDSYQINNFYLSDEKLIRMWRIEDKSFY